MDDTKYKLSLVKFQGNRVPILWEKSKKCSPLVALANFNNLKNRLDVPTSRLPDTTSQNFLTSQIEQSIKKFFRPGSPSPHEENFLHLAKSLHRQCSLNPASSACYLFEDTDVYSLFKLLGVDLLHGWVMEPEHQNFKTLGGLPYQSMAVISTLKTSDKTHIREDALAAESFLNASNHQLTSFGLQQLSDNVVEKGLAVLYREDEFNLLYKHDGDLFTLEVCEDQLTQLPTGVWKKLTVEEEQSFYVTENLSPTIGQHEERYRKANEWFSAKISAFDDDKKPSQKKKRKYKKKVSAVSPHSEGSSTSEAATLASQQSNEELSASQQSNEELSASQQSNEELSASLKVIPLTAAQKFLNFLMQFQDESGALYFETAVKEMISTSSPKLYVPFALLQNHDGNLAIEIQDGYPRIHNELRKSVADFIVKCDSNAAIEDVDLEIQNLPKPKWNKTYLQFIEENDMVNTYLLYDGTKDDTPTLTGNAMALGYLYQVLDNFEELKGWSEVVSEEGKQITEGWRVNEMEVRDNGTKFVITKKADVPLTREVAVSNLFTYVHHVFGPFESTDLKRCPAFFDTFVSDILLCPEPNKDSLQWKRYLKYMRSPLAFKVPLVRSTLMTEVHTVLSLEIMLTPLSYQLLTRSGIIKDWTDLVSTEKPFSHVYQFRIYSVWEVSHWAVIQFSRHFVIHVLDYLKKMRFLHDIGIVELMLARRLEYFIADTVRTIVMEYGVDQVFSSAWGHFEGSNSTTMPLQIISEVTSSPSIALKQIDTLVIRLPPKKSVRLKLPTSLEIDISPQKRVLHLLDIKKHLESKGWEVEELDDAVGEDCILIRMIVNAEARKLGIQSNFCTEYQTVLNQLCGLLVGDNDDLE